MILDFVYQKDFFVVLVLDRQLFFLIVFKLENLCIIKNLRCFCDFCLFVQYIKECYITL